MVETTYSLRIKRYTIGVSVIIHVLLLLWLLGVTYEQRQLIHNTNESLADVIHKPKQTDEQWASVKARRGAPILVVDMPQAPITQQDVTSDAPPVIPQPIQIAQQEPPKTLPKSHTNEAKQEQIEHSAPIPQPALTSLFVQAAQQALAQNMRAHQQPKSVVSQPTQSQPRQQSSQNTRTFPSLTQIAQGFGQYAQEEGEYTINVMGDPRKLPTEQQLKQHHYVEKLLSCLHASYVTMKDKEPLVHNKVQNPLLTMVIHKDGSISELRITQSSSYAPFDSFCLSLFTDAARSFPPLPSYFNRETYRMNWIVVTR